MSDYTKTVNFAAKDNLVSGNPGKVVKGTEIDTEFNDIATAIATKANSANPVFTGTFETGFHGLTIDDATNSGVTAVNSYTHTTSGTPANGIGVGTDFIVETAGGEHTVGQVNVEVTDITDTAEDADFVVNLMKAGATASEAFRVGSTGIVTTTGSIVSDTDSTDDLGTTGVRWANAYIDDLDITTNIVVGGTVDGRDVAADGTKLDGIETGATSDQSDAEIKTAYENNADTNAYTDSEKTKLATVETNADVTDATNVNAAGAVMNTDTTTAAMSFVIDEDAMGSDSATKVPTQQSTKAYVDAQLIAANSLSGALLVGNSTGGTDVVVTAGDVITTDTINETTAAAGVTIDGVLLKDSTVSGLIIGTDVQAELSGASLTSATAAATDKVLIQDADDADNLKTVTTQSIADLAEVTKGTLTKTFTTGEVSTIDLTSSVLAPVVSVTKEVPQSGVTNNNWDVNSTTENYTRLDSAAATTLTPSATGDGTFTLGTGAFAAADVGKTITGNGGVAILTTTGGAYVTSTAFTDTSAISSGSWSMYGVVYNTVDGDLELSGGVTGAYDMSTAVYSQGFSVASQDTSPNGMTFNTDGTKMFVCGQTGNDVNEYTLSTGFDASTSVFVDSFSVSGQTTTPTGIAFNTDGTKMFVCGYGEGNVNEYTLSTGFDVSSASYVDFFSVSVKETAPTGLAFNTDGTKMFVTGTSNDYINEYSLTAFDVSTSVFVYRHYLGTQDTLPQGIAFNADGTKLLVLGMTGQDVNEYTLSTGFDVSTISYVRLFSVASQEIYPHGLAFNTDGTKMFVVGENSDTVYEYTVGSFASTSGYHPVHTTDSIDSTYWTDINSMTADQAAGDGNVYYAISTDDRTTWTVVDDTDGERDIVRNNAGTWQYNSNGTYASETWTAGATNTELATLAEAMEGAASVVNAFDVSTAVYSQNLSILAQDNSPSGLAFNADGTKMFMVGYQNDSVNEYALSTGFDVSTASFTDAFSVAAQEDTPFGLAFSADGTKMFVCGLTGQDVNEYTLSTGFDVSTASYTRVFSVASQETQPTGLIFNTDGTKLFVVGYTSDNVNEYALSTGFNVSTAVFTDAFSVTAQDSVPSGLAFNTDGTKMYVCGQVGKDVNEYTLTTGFDVSTASYTQVFNPTITYANPPVDIAFNTDGSKMLVLGQGTHLVSEYTVGSTSYTNKMDKTQLDAVTDPNHIALGNDLDLSIIFNMTSGTTVPSSDGVAINYDANVLNQGAVLGTDYDWDFPATNKVRVAALTSGNYKVRVV